MRATRILLELAFVATITLTLYQFRPSAPVPDDPPPIDFKLVMERYDKVRGVYRDRAEVEALLGPPTERNASGADVGRLEAYVVNGNAGRDLYPSERLWDKWSDPTDPNRWVI